jgi:hypothetical protein
LKRGKAWGGKVEASRTSASFNQLYTDKACFSNVRHDLIGKKGVVPNTSMGLELAL